MHSTTARRIETSVTAFACGRAGQQGRDRRADGDGIAVLGVVDTASSADGCPASPDAALMIMTTPIAVPSVHNRKA
jgi:hypothetical protein